MFNLFPSFSTLLPLGLLCLTTIISYFDLNGLTSEESIRVLMNALNALDNSAEALTLKKLNFDTPSKLKTNYDFIIVGSGSAGATLANRLSEIPEWNILLLEVGTTENFISSIPLLAPALQYTPYNWEYYMEPQDNLCQGLVNGRMHWPRGKAVGGTSVINYMIYTRGNKVDYDNWKAAGNPGWGYEDVLPYYIKSEKSSLRQEDAGFHGHDGPLSVSDTYQSPLVRAFVKGAELLGLPNVDYNGPKVTPFGASTVHGTLKCGQRNSVARAYLEPVKGRRNLKIVTQAFVTKVLIDPATKTAYGVTFDRYGTSTTILANKEVILSAGAFNSPQLLMLAGIGPREHLQQLGIPVLKDLPVGQNLQDHLTFPGMTFLINEPLSLSFSNVLTPKAVKDFLIDCKGPLTSLGGVEGIGYIKTPYAVEKGPQPDMELLFIGASLASDLGLIVRKGMKITDKVYNGLFKPVETKPQWTVFPMHIHPKSVGYLKLNSTNPYDYPLFYGNFFTDEGNTDVKSFIYAVRFVQELAKTPEFVRLGSTMNPNVHPGCEGHTFDSDAYWECCIRSISVTLHHQVGTAKMGPESDPTTVVNHELKVHGIFGLRVVDCSVIPRALSAHTNAPSIMVGEKAGDMIKQTYNKL